MSTALLDEAQLAGGIQVRWRLHIDTPSEASRMIDIDRLPFLIGKSSKDSIGVAHLSGWKVSRQHAEIRAGRAGLKLVDLGSLSGTWVNGERIAEYGPLDVMDEILIAGHRLRIMPVSQAEAGASSIFAQKLTSDVTNQSSSPSSPSTLWTDSTKSFSSAFPSGYEEMANWQRIMLRRLFDSIDFRRQDLNVLAADQLRVEVSLMIAALFANTQNIPSHIDAVQLQRMVLDEAVGFGALEPLLSDPSVTEIMVNGPDKIYVEKQGCLSLSEARFSSAESLRGVIDRIVSPLGRRIDESSPMVDARLPDGSRVNAIVEPLAIGGAALTIRKFSRSILTTDHLVAIGSVKPALVDFLTLCVKERKNIVVSGGTGSGKTTLLNVLSNLIPDGQRVLTIEDAAELKLSHSHWVSLEARMANAEGKGTVTIRDLVKNALRMRPDRIIVGECRGAETFDMLQAMNTGHDGSLTTVHANTPRDALRRFEAMVLMSGIDMPLAAIREQIVSAVDFIVQTSRLANGRRVVSEVIEVVGLESQKVQTQTIFRWDAKKAELYGCEIIPQFLEEIVFEDLAHKSHALNLFRNDVGVA